jgi:muramoyltetrapeptide carboxypeptidase
MPNPPTIGIITPCSVTPQVELAMGVDRLTAAGFDVRVHPQCAEQHLWFAGDDKTRADALFEFAQDPAIDVLWSGRGGSGAPRLLPILDELTTKHGKPPKKLLAGYSDVTALHHYVHTRWGWSTLHASMPASDFYDISDNDFQATLDLVSKKRIDMPWRDHRMSFLTPAPTETKKGTLVGGNLAVWNYLTGTPYQPRDMKGKFLFFEDLSEGYYRIDGMFSQIEQAGGLDGLAGIVLGDFCACDDSVAKVLKHKPEPDRAADALKQKDKQETIPLRPVLGEIEALTEIFARRGEKHGFPVAYKLPVGHGPNFAPLPLNADYELTPDGAFKLVAWDWLDD